MVTTCEKHEEILAQAKAILEKIRETMVQQKRLLESEGVSHEFLQYDRQLELLMGEKERAVGALREHDEEHGCQNHDVLWNPNAPSSN